MCSMAPAPPPSAQLTSTQAMALPLTLASGVCAFGLLDVVRRQPLLVESMLGAGLLLAVWSGVVWWQTRRRQRALVLEVVLRRQHYMQGAAQGAIFVYWGWYWPPVYGAAYLIAAQLVFAYAFDMLLGWSRRDTYTLGLGPFPVIFSINLFLWFTPDWFWLQLLMVAAGFAVKELVRWHRDGRYVHIFNPSSFPLAVASLMLLATGTSEMTVGQQIASTQGYPPQMYLVLFLLALPNGLAFGVASMTMAAVLTTYLFGQAYFAATGIYYFYDTSVPIAVFLGMHFLFTDPSTSPGTGGGRIAYGVLYGIGVVGGYSLLGHLGLPTFYDKLLPVPLLNLSVRAIDRTVKSWGQAAAPRTATAVAGPHTRSVLIWATTFAVMTAGQALGDQHPGQGVPFWQAACDDGRRYACDYLFDTQSSYCDAGSGWACNELGILQTRQLGDRAGAARSFDRGCELGSMASCQNLSWTAGQPHRAPPSPADLPIVLGGNKGPIGERSPETLSAMACQQGFVELCGEVTPSP